MSASKIGGGGGAGEAPERAVLVSVRCGGKSQKQAEESLHELGLLAETAGAEIAGAVLQTRTRPHPSTLIGRGKLSELSSLVSHATADMVIFDHDLTPSQQRNLEGELQIKVIDRTALILDIFALHAQSKEGKAQVEMAQLRYGLTRLAGRGVELSRLGGGIGTRGPGETKLESDRRRINSRIRTLDRELRDLSRMRRVKRKLRERQHVPTFALVGYTNAGKSSLLNRLTDAHVLVEDQLFSTLDPITRRIVLPANRRAVVTDTVGFIEHLPHQLVEAFKSTLEEIAEADALLHVIDGSTSGVRQKTVAVEGVLVEIGAGDLPAIHVINKCDLMGEDDRMVLRRIFPGGVLASALTGEGLEELTERMSSLLTFSRVMNLRMPYSRGELLSLLYRRAQILYMESAEEGYRIDAEVPLELAQRFEPYSTASIADACEGEDPPL